MAGEHCSSLWEGSLGRETHGLWEGRGQALGQPLFWTSIFLRFFFLLWDICLVAPNTGVCYPVDYLLLFFEHSARHRVATLHCCWMTEWITSRELWIDKHPIFFFFFFFFYNFQFAVVYQIFWGWFSDLELKGVSNGIFKVQRSLVLFHYYWVMWNGRSEACWVQGEIQILIKHEHWSNSNMLHSCCL